MQSGSPQEGRLRREGGAAWVNPSKDRPFPQEAEPEGLGRGEAPRAQLAVLTSGCTGQRGLGLGWGWSTCPRRASSGRVGSTAGLHQRLACDMADGHFLGHPRPA